MAQNKNSRLAFKRNGIVGTLHMVRSLARRYNKE